MMIDLFVMTENQARGLCKEALESLEFWLRRLIHDSLEASFGENYLDAEDGVGRHVIKNAIRNKIRERYQQEPQRYRRLIDASLLEHQIDIVCNPELYSRFFRDALQHAFPNGREEAHTFLKRLESPRNSLYHANPISVRQCEQVICYSHDVIDSLKEYYRMNNREKEYNVPTVIKATDSFGNVFHFNESTTNSYHLTDQPRFYLRPGDTLSIELEIDPSFDESEYTLDWSGDGGISGDTKKLVLKIEEKHVRGTLMIGCNVISKRNWHKYGGFDYNFYCTYKVLPPLY